MIIFNNDKPFGQIRLTKDEMVFVYRDAKEMLFPNVVIFHVLEERVFKHDNEYKSLKAMFISHKMKGAQHDPRNVAFQMEDRLVFPRT